MLKNNPLCHFFWFVTVALSHPLFGSQEELSTFDRFMGKNTPYWTHVQSKEDLSFLEKYRSLYEKKRRLLELVSHEIRIPKTVHIIWLGPRPFPPASVDNLRTWVALHPEWNIQLWSDRQREPPCQGVLIKTFSTYPFSRLKKFYDSSQNWGEKSDLLRFEILWNEGGVYIDHDANALRSFAPLHAHFDFYCGLEVPHPLIGKYHLTAGIGLFGSKPFHPIVGKIIDKVENRWENLQKLYADRHGFEQIELVLQRTYLPLTEVLETYTPTEFDLVLPAAYFFAHPGIEPLYSKHFFGDSWTGEFRGNLPFQEKIGRELSKADRHFSRIVLWVLIGTLLNVCLVYKIAKDPS